MTFITRLNSAVCLRGVIASVVVFVLVGFVNRDVFSQSAAPPRIRILSSVPDLVSGGDALVEVKAPAGRALHRIILTLNGKDITGQLKIDAATSSLRGVISGLIVGENVLVARAGKTQASLKVTNYPITGPILSGPHLTPYECRTVESGLGQPLDAHCSARQKIE
jgi:hypothetical protein